MVSKEWLITIGTILLITYTASLSFVSQAYPATQEYATFSNQGTIQIQTTTGIGIYTDSTCTSELSSLSWGTIEPGQSQSKTFWIKNEGSSPTTLSFATSDWNPTNALTYIHPNWNYYGSEIDPDSEVQITLTLSVDSNIQGIETFGFDLTIIGTS